MNAAPAAGRRVFPSSLWFPVAAAHAALILPWSVLAQFQWVPAPASLAASLGHAHEMLFGFALAVVAGYTLRPRQGHQEWGLFAVWLAARVSFLIAPASWPAALCNGLFAIGLASAVVPVYLRTDKWRNRSVGFIILGLMLTVLAVHGIHRLARTALMSTLLLDAVLLLSTLMFFMGGRIIAPAIAGHIRQSHAPLRHVVQARLEGGTLALLATAMLVNLLPWHGARPACGALLLACAALTLTRMLRWRCWLGLGRADLLALLAGYSWLIVGWVLIGTSMIAGQAPTSALHAITVGALGTLTFSVMLRTQMFRCLHDTSALPWAYAGVVPMAMAATLRVTSDAHALLALAAACWSLCHASLLVILLWLARRRSAGETGNA